MSIEEQLANRIFSQNPEKTFIDKVLAKDDAERIRLLVRKTDLSREDMKELLYLITSLEAKLINLSPWERYVILKFFVWIREFLKVAEGLYDYQDDLKKREHICNKCNKFFRKWNNKEVNCKCKIPVPKITVSERTHQVLDNCERNIEHNVRFLVDLYLNIARTSLSLGASGFLEILKNKYEFSYPQQGVSTPIEEKGIKSFLGFKK